METTDVVGLKISDPTGSVSLLLNDGRWSTQDHIADPRRVDRSIGNLLGLKGKGPIEPQGLHFATEVTVQTAQGESRVLKFGPKIPGGKGVYVESGNQIFASDRLPFEEPVLDVNYFRSRRVFQCARSRVHAIAVRGAQTLQISRTPYGWVTDEGGRTVPADRESVGQFLDALFDLRIDSFEGIHGVDNATERSVSVNLLDSEGQILDGSSLSMSAPWRADIGENAWYPSTSGFSDWVALDAEMVARRSVTWFDTATVNVISISTGSVGWGDDRDPNWSSTHAEEILGLLSRDTGAWFSQDEYSKIGTLTLGLIGNTESVVLDFGRAPNGGIVWVPHGSDFGIQMGLSESDGFLSLLTQLH